MSAETSKRSRSRAAKIATRKARLAKLDVKREREKDSIRALEAVDKLVSRKAESRDKVLIGIAALAAARTDPAVGAAIDAAIQGLSERERIHLGRDGSLWAQLGAKSSDDAQRVEAPVVSVTADDPDLAPVSFKPDAKRLWRWYEDWDDHGSLFSAMRMERNAFGFWLAKTYMQEKALALLGRHSVVRFDGMNRQETENLIYEEAERDVAEPDPMPSAPKELVAAFMDQQARRRLPSKRSSKV